MNNTGTAQRGIFSNGTFTLLANLTSTNDTLHVENGRFALTGTVSITGTARVGWTLTADTDALGGEGAFSFQWRRGEAIVGTNSRTYAIRPEDVGHTFTVTVTRAGNFGDITSEPTQPVGTPAYDRDFTITFADFMDITTEITGPVIHLLSDPDRASGTITVVDPDQYDYGSIGWFFGGSRITGDAIGGDYGETLTLDSRIHGNRLGRHFVTVEVEKDGVLFSKVITFTVVR